MARAVAVSRKLELTSAALGCMTRKELCAAFARINPNTTLTLQNSYNWMSGRATPRSFSFFQDWATLLDLQEGPQFLVSCSVAEFAGALVAKGLLPRQLLDGLRDQQDARVPEVHDLPSVRWRNGTLLSGSFLAISPSWSPEAKGSLLAGALTVELRNPGRLAARYVESVLGEHVVFSGSGLEDGRTGQLILQCEANGASYYMSFHLPPLPGNLAGGIFAGNAIYDPDSQPTASPILFLRNHHLKVRDLEGLAGYCDGEAAGVARYLAALGYGLDPAHGVEQRLLDLLRPSPDSSLILLQRNALAALAPLLDQRRLDVMER